MPPRPACCACADDKRIPPSDKQPVASRAPASTLRPQHYGTPFDGGATQRSTTQHKVMRGYMKPSPTSVLLATLRWASRMVVDGTVRSSTPKRWQSL